MAGYSVAVAPESLTAKQAFSYEELFPIFDSAQIGARAGSQMREKL